MYGAVPNVIFHVCGEGEVKRFVCFYSTCLSSNDCKIAVDTLRLLSQFEWQFSIQLTIRNLTSVRVKFESNQDPYETNTH